jgi:hypothetical protein
MKKRVAPPEKKKLAYERDHYVSGGESRHAYRKNWPKKKAMLNQKHRHRAAQALHELEKLGDFESIEDSRIEVTAEQLRKVDPREKLSKFGVKSLREYVDKNQEERQGRAFWRSHNRALITVRCTGLIATLEKNPASPEAQAFLREVAAGGGWGWDFHLFLSWKPEWRPRLEKAWLAVTKALEKAELKRQQKETEKQRTKALLSAIQKQTKVR